MERRDDVRGRKEDDGYLTFVATFCVCLVACDVEDTAFDADADGVAVVFACLGHVS